MFAAESEKGDIENGTIYVLRSQSTHPYITEHREFIHEIGVTGGNVETRIAAAQLDLTIADRFGNPVKPREWFLVQLHVMIKLFRIYKMELLHQ